MEALLIANGSSVKAAQSAVQDSKKKLPNGFAQIAKSQEDKRQAGGHMSVPGGSSKKDWLLPLAKAVVAATDPNRPSKPARLGVPRTPFGTQSVV